MKILFLTSRINAEHEISVALAKKGVGVLFPADAGEAWQMLRLHGASIDLGIIHREGPSQSQADAGLKLIRKIKADPVQADLPIILTTSEWSDEDCARHQESSEGVNAYLKDPFNGAQLTKLIESVLGEPLGASTSTYTPPQATHSPVQFHQEGSVLLEDASEVFLRSETPGEPSESIILEAPDFEGSNSTPIQQDIPTAEHTSVMSLESLGEIAVSPEPSHEVELVEEVSEAVEPSVLQSVQDIPIEEIPEASIEGEIREESSEGVFTESQIDDKEVIQEMPYLFGDSNKRATDRRVDPVMVFAEPLGDAVVPGGAAKSPDLETIKRYLFLREQDVAVLSNQLKAAQDQIALLEQQIRNEKAAHVELGHTVNEQRQKINSFEAEKNNLADSLQSEIAELRFQVKAKSDKVRVFEGQVREVSEEMSHLKDRVRADIRKIRVREKELENRIEIMKKDSEALISARENKIIELKRKLDLLEFNMDLLQDQYTREKEHSFNLRERLARVAQAVRVAGGLLDTSKGLSSQEEQDNGDKQAS
jgi:CheY-like chemotaxis protein